MRNGSATVLGNKGKFGIFEEVIGEDDEFAHKDCESEFLGLARGEKALIEGAKDGIVAGGD